MTISISTLRPGLLVHLTARIIGGVSYDREDIVTEHTETDGAKVSEWKTAKRIEDAAEYERATEARNLARRAVARVCFATQISGLLCPEAKESDLRSAVDEARKIAADFNASARNSRVEIGVIVGRIANDDASAARAVANEIRGLLADMERGIAAADPDAIRKAATQARITGAMLSDVAKAKVDAAIDEARAAATALVKRVEKSGEIAAAVVSECKIDAIRTAAFAFLDFEERAAAPVAVTAASVDLVPEAPAAAAPAASPAIDL